MDEERLPRKKLEEEEKEDLEIRGCRKKRELTTWADREE
jgi:hypothetical protein